MLLHGAVRQIFKIIGVIVLGLILALPLLIWRLSQGPLPLDFLTPSLKSAAMAQDGSWHVGLDKTVLALGQGRHVIEVQALGVRLFSNASDEAILAVPKVAVSFNGRSLLLGNLSPSAIRVEGPRLRVVRDKDGQISLGLNGPGEGTISLAMVLDALTGSYDPAKPARQLRELAISGAELTLDDHLSDHVWTIPVAELSARRTTEGGAFNFGLAFDRDLGLGTLQAKGQFVTQGGLWSVQLVTAGLHLSPFARLSAKLEGLSAVDFPVSGSVHVGGDLQNGLQTVDFDLKGEGGRIRLLSPVGMQYQTSALSLKGGLDLGLHQLKLHEFKLALTDGVKLSASVAVDGLGIDGPLAINAEASYDHIAFDNLKHLWPEIVAPNPREWILENLSKGMIHDGSIALEGVWKPSVPDDLDVKKLAGKFSTTGLSVNYISPMSLVHDIWGVATFDQKAFRVEMKGGEVAGLKVSGGTAVFTGLDQNDQFASIEASATGSLVNVLKLIDEKPLGYASIMGIDPAVAGGEAVTHLALQFPLLKDLKLDDLVIKVHSELDNVRLPKVVAGLDVDQGKLILDLDGKGMDVTGTLAVNAVPASLQWRENFTSKTPFKSRYVLKATQVDTTRLTALGLDTPPFVAPWLTGKIDATVTALVNRQSKVDLDVDADLSSAQMDIEGLAWRKEAKTTGGAKIKIAVEGARIVAVPQFEVVAGDLKCDGAVLFDGGGRAQRVEIKHLNYGRTSMTSTLDLQSEGGGLSIVSSGESFDAASLISHDERPGDKKIEGKDLTPLHIMGQFKRLWLSKSGSISDVNQTMIRQNGDWRTVTVTGKVGKEGKEFNFNISPLTPTERKLKLDSGDAGAVLRAFDVYDDMVGGNLSIDGRFDDARVNKPLDGTIHISDYSVVNTPALSRLLTVASLTGVVDLLKGDGVSFSTLDAPFVLADGVLTVKDASTAGSAVGVTANGEIDMDRNRLKLEGTLVPFYTFNSALGGVPVIGWLLNGGEKGGGIVAFNFSMKGPSNDPDVVINPLSALTPGFLRRFFDVFDDAQKREGQKQEGTPRKQ